MPDYFDCKINFTTMIFTLWGKTPYLASKINIENDNSFDTLQYMSLQTELWKHFVH